jgi:hypothetical protein
MEESMGVSQHIDSTRTIAWQAGASPTALAECQKVALQQQHELLEDAQQRMAAWLRRRQVALETGIDALTRMSACKAPVEMAAIYGEWMAGSITRILADVDDAQAHTAKLAEHFHKATSTLLEAPQAAPAEPAPSAEIRQPAETEVPPAQQQLRAAA